MFFCGSWYRGIDRIMICCCVYDIYRYVQQVQTMYTVCTGTYVYICIIQKKGPSFNLKTVRLAS